MQSNVVNHSFFSETLRCFYHIFGYDAVLKELQFIHHLDSTSNSLQATTPPTVTPIVQQSPPDTTHTFISQPVSSDLVTVHKISNTVIQPSDQNSIHDSIHDSTPLSRVKYSRSLKPDSQRCVAITSRGDRCSLSKLSLSTFCRNHLKAHS